MEPVQVAQQIFEKSKELDVPFKRMAEKINKRAETMVAHDEAVAVAIATLRDAGIPPRSYRSSRQGTRA